MMPVAVVAQAGGPSAAVAPASALASASTAPPLLSMAGPTFTVPENKLSKHVVVIAYGDMRFHDPTNTKMANPAARQILVAKVAAEHPDAVQTNGDVPYKGSDAADYDVFRSETAVWREQQLRVYPAMGNHELSGGPEKAAQGVENWWNAFPDLRGRRWYSVALGKRIYLLQLDSDLPLTEGSAQMEWIKGQIAGLPRSVDYVMIGMHHPPVADIQTRIEVDHNPRPNEIALRDYLTKIQPTTHARILVTAGHIHNYERHVVGDVVYLVSGGGGAVPYQVERTPDDLYQDTDFPNFHYVKFELERNELKATMYRLADPAAATPVWQVKDSFAVKKK
ncbi:MAG TPA: metallophosphoesterase [Granulicella sp.]|nr:metallophosphoesterase [Granulicella sp.]